MARQPTPVYPSATPHYPGFYPIHLHGITSFTPITPKPNPTIAYIGGGSDPVRIGKVDPQNWGNWGNTNHSAGLPPKNHGVDGVDGVEFWGRPSGQPVQRHSRARARLSPPAGEPSERLTLTPTWLRWERVSRARTDLQRASWPFPIMPHGPGSSRQAWTGLASGVGWVLTLVEGDDGGQRGIVRALTANPEKNGGHREGGLGQYLGRLPSKYATLAAGTEIEFRLPGGGLAITDASPVWGRANASESTGDSGQGTAGAGTRGVQ